MISKRKAILSAVVNFLLFATTVGVVISYFFEEPGPLIKTGWESFKFFTTDSNVLAAVASLLVAIFDIKIIRGREKTLPQWVVYFKFVTTVSLMLTMCTVLCQLVPKYGLEIPFAGTGIYMHAIAPLAALFSFILLEKCFPLSNLAAFLAIIPPFIYGMLYLLMVVILPTDKSVWWDFYSLNEGGHWYMSCLIIFTASGLLGMFLVLLYNLGIPKNKQQEPPANDDPSQT